MMFKVSVPYCCTKGQPHCSDRIHFPILRMERTKPIVFGCRCGEFNRWVVDIVSYCSGRTKCEDMDRRRCTEVKDNNMYELQLDGVL